MPAPDGREALIALLRDALSTDEFNTVRAMIDALTADPDAPTTDRKTGADSMTTIADWRALQRAEAETGILGQDSAAHTYRAAIRQLGHSVPLMPTQGMRTAWQLAKRQAAGKPRAMATDAKATAARNSMFPNANRLLSGF